MSTEIKSIALADAAACDALKVTFMDVRYAGDYHRGHIKGAISLPFYRLDKIDLPKDRPIITYCSGIGCSLSMDAAAKLTEMGYTNARYLLGGISEWELKGHPIVRDTVDVKPAGPGIFEGGDIQPPLVNKNLKKLYILDVRPQAEFEAGHLPGAWNIPLERWPSRAQHSRASPSPASASTSRASPSTSPRTARTASRRSSRTRVRRRSR